MPTAQVVFLCVAVARPGPPHQDHLGERLQLGLVLCQLCSTVRNRQTVDAFLNYVVALVIPFFHKFLQPFGGELILQDEQ